jgi:hypothetical protein
MAQGNLVQALSSFQETITERLARADPAEPRWLAALEPSPLFAQFISLAGGEDKVRFAW